MNLHLSRLCWLLVLGSAASLAQDPIDEVVPDEEPAVNTSEVIEERDEVEPAVSSGDLAAAGIEVEPAPASQVLAADVRRTSARNGVMDELDLGRTEITGNQELPKVLYIVPWQKSDPGDLMGRPVNTLLDEILTPIDRSEFIRQVDYYGDLHEKDEE